MGCSTLLATLQSCFFAQGLPLAEGQQKGGIVIQNSAVILDQEHDAVVLDRGFEDKSLTALVANAVGLASHQSKRIIARVGIGGAIDADARLDNLDVGQLHPDQHFKLGNRRWQRQAVVVNCLLLGIKISAKAPALKAHVINHRDLRFLLALADIGDSQDLADGFSALDQHLIHHKNGALLTGRMDGLGGQITMANHDGTEILSLSHDAILIVLVDDLIIPYFCKK
ncbi:hypothetical protein D3C80_18250 [compost metagenome]